MLDDLRQQANEKGFDELEEEEEEPQEEVGSKKLRLPKLPTFGLTPAQRLFIAILLLAATCSGSFAVLLLTGKIAIP